jgi:hypothetical protein
VEAALNKLTDVTDGRDYANRRFRYYANATKKVKFEFWLFVPKVLLRENSKARLKFLYESSWCLLKDDAPAYYVTTVNSTLRGGDQLSVLFPDLRPENRLKRRFQRVEGFKEFVTAEFNSGSRQVFCDYF